MKFIPFDYAVRNLGRSPRRFGAILAGNALVIFLVISASAFVEGMRASMGLRQDSQNVLLLAQGSEESIERSEIPATTGGILSASLRGIRTEAGVPFISPEVLSALIFFENKDSSEELRAIVRGVTSGAYLVHKRVEITKGRAPRAGTNELMAGSLVAEKFGLPTERLEIGETFWFEGIEWTIVGHFNAKGTVMEAELWTALTDLQVATKRDGLSCVIATLGTAEFADIDAFTKQRIDLELSAVMEADYYASLLQFFYPVRVMIWITAILISLAGVLGGLNTLYSAFASRVREIGMLQSLGFSRRAIVISLMQESLLAAAGGVLLASLAAKLLVEGTALSYSMGVFELAVNNTALMAGSATGLLLGLLGAIPPAWRCLRMPIPESLRAA